MEITRFRETITWVFQVCFLSSKNISRVCFKARFTSNEIRTKTSNIGKAVLKNCVIHNYLVCVLWIIQPFPWVNKKVKIRKVGSEFTRHHHRWSNFCDSQWELICCSKWHLEACGIFAPPEIAIVTHFHVRHGTKTTQLLLLPDGKAD